MKLISLSPLNTGDLAVWKGPDLCWVGRADTQVKILGQKLNLDHLNSRISSILNRETYCLVHKSNATKNNEAMIITFVIDEEPLNAKHQINLLLQKHLRPQELPAKIILLPRFPLNRHNKIDRNALKDLVEMEKNIPKTVDEKLEVITKLWKDLIGHAPSDDDNFINAGGDSFLAVNLVNKAMASIPDVKESLFEVVVEKSFKDIKYFIINETVIKDESSQIPSKRLKLHHDNELIKPKENTSKIHESEEIIVKLKGRTSAVQNAQFKINLDYLELDTSKELSFQSKWKVDFEKCIDGSPIYVSLRGNEEEYLVCGAHSGYIFVSKLS